MRLSHSFLGAVLVISSTLTFASAFFDPVRFESVSELDSGRVVFLISPPGIFSEVEVSWPHFCWNVRLVAPRESQHTSISVDEHRAALSRLQEATRTKATVNFGSGGRGLIPTKGNRCELNSKALRIETDVNGKDAVISFNEG